MADNMYYGASHLIMKRAEFLRLKTTPAEAALWDYLRINDWQLKFRRQHAISKFIADFYCHSLKLVIELDGSVHDNEDVKFNDEKRENYLKELGLTIIRFSNEDVFQRLPNTINRIGETVNHLLKSRPMLHMGTPLGDGGKIAEHLQQGQSMLHMDTPLVDGGKKAEHLQQDQSMLHMGTPLGDGGKMVEHLQQDQSMLHMGTPLGDGGKKNDKEKKLTIIKIGGNIIDDEPKLASFLKDFATIEGKKILVHGGGKLATRIAEAMGIQQQMVEGRRITDGETLKVVTMVYAGYINKNIVAQLQANGCNAIGLCGADGNVIQSHKRGADSPLGVGGIDYGFAGDVDSVNCDLLQTLLNNGFSVILSPITHNKNGQLLNTNADTIAQETAKALSSFYDVSLIYSFEKSGVLLDANDDATVIPTLTKAHYEELKTPLQGMGAKIFAGMIPKLDNAFAALSSGVSKVIIGKAEQLHELISGSAGTTIEASPSRFIGTEGGASAPDNFEVSQNSNGSENPPRPNDSAGRALEGREAKKLKL